MQNTFVFFPLTSKNMKNSYLFYIPHSRHKDYSKFVGRGIRSYFCCFVWNRENIKMYEGCFSWFNMGINFSRLIRNLKYYPFNVIHIFLTNPTHRFYINHILIKFNPFLSLNVWLQYQLHEIRNIKTFKSFTSSLF